MIRKMPVRSTGKCQLPPTRRAIIQQYMLDRVWRKGGPAALLLGMETGAAPVENITEGP